MSEVTEKLTKKQRKALEFRKGKKEKPTESTTDETKKRKRDDGDEVAEADKETAKSEATEGEPKKKRKTRRGKKGKGSNGKPRFLLFVGNLPYDITETELVTHFAASSPDNIRLRKDKGIAFLEFDGSGGDIQKKMGVALKMHHSTLRQRKINVELTVGGGGNSQNRLEKIKTKNEKLDDERKDEIEKKKEERIKKLKQREAPMDMSKVHPARAAALRR